MRKCPVCESNKFIKIISLPLSLPTGINFIDDYNLIRCETCGFFYADIKGDQNDLDKYYFNDSKYETLEIQSVGGGGVSQEDKIRLLKTFKLIEPYLNKNTNILDIGTANGGLLEVFKDNGYLFLTGIEPAKQCCINTIELVGCTCYNNSFINQDFNQKFDFISVTHVLEHVLDVKSFMNKIYDILNPNGIVYIECPDINSYKKYIHGPFQEFNTEHINHFGIDDYENLAKMNKFKVVTKGTYEISITSKLNYVSVYCFFKKSSVKTSETILKNDSFENITNYIGASDKMLRNFHDWAIKIDQTIFLYGIGQLSYKIICILKNLNKSIVLIDGDSIKNGKEIEGLKIHDLNHIENFNKEGILLICSVISAESIELDLIKKSKKKLNILPIGNCFK